MDQNYCLLSFQRVKDQRPQIEGIGGVGGGLYAVNEDTFFFPQLLNFPLG